ncbi:MAG: hypothetical protein WC401_10680 [Bacteroidales bacterium]
MKKITLWEYKTKPMMKRILVCGWHWLVLFAVIDFIADAVMYWIN